MSRQKQQHQVNLFRPKSGHMRDEVVIILAILFGWAICTFGFQIILALTRKSGAESMLTNLTVFNLPLHFWFTGQFLPLWFIVLCVIFNLYIDRITEYHSRRRDRSYE